MHVCRTAAVGVCGFVLLGVAGGGLAARPISPVLCTRSMTATSVLEFVTAFNAGDQRRLSRVFVDASQFKWYSVTRTRQEHFVTHGKAALLRYFADRHARKEGLAIMHFRFGTASRLGGNFSYRLLRWADDICDRRPEVYCGKGASGCT